MRLLLILAVAMPLSLGIESPLDYSVFSRVGGRALLATGDPGRHP